MTQNLNTVLSQVSKDKGIDKNILVEAIEASILTAAKKVFGYERMLDAHFDEALAHLAEAVTALGVQVSKAITRSVTALADHDVELAEAHRQEDDPVKAEDRWR